MKSIYDLELHEEIEISNDTFVMRVPGGWRYLGAQSSIFVPYDNEFHPDELKRGSVGFSSRTKNKE